MPTKCADRRLKWKGCSDRPPSASSVADIRLRRTACIGSTWIDQLAPLEGLRTSASGPVPLCKATRARWLGTSPNAMRPSACLMSPEDASFSLNPPLPLPHLLSSCALCPFPRTFPCASNFDACFSVLGREGMGPNVLCLHPCSMNAFLFSR